MGLPVLNIEQPVTISKDVMAGTELSQSFSISNKRDALISIFNTYQTTKAEIVALDLELGKYSAGGSYLAPNRKTLSEAIKELDCDCWNKAINLIEIDSLMSQSDRSAWEKSLDDKAVPEFEHNIVLATLNDLLNQSQTYFARRIDEIFKGLSEDHKTNPAHAFGSKMIFDLVGRDRCMDTSITGLIDDLRNVIAMFLGLDPVVRGSSYDYLKRLVMDDMCGEWHDMDMGVVRIKTFKKGTAHLSVDPDISWRLNEILAELYGLSLPKAFKRETETYRKPSRFIFPKARAISSPVIEFLQAGRAGLDRTHLVIRETIKNSIAVHNAYKLGQSGSDELFSVLHACGGVLDKVHQAFVFDYNFKSDVLPYILGNRCYPDTISHQYFPTYEKLSSELVELADIEDHHSCCEPSAGTGNIAKLMPADTVCVEISDVRCKALEASGFDNVIKADFLEWSQTSSGFDRIVSNPPYHRSLAKLHTEASMRILNSKGVLATVVPASLKDSLDTSGFSSEWSEPFRFESKDANPMVCKVKLIKL